MKTVHVIGAGITGLITAYELNRRGHRVIVIDQERYSAQRCSRANGGQSSVSNSEVWTTYENLKKGASWMFKSDAPLYISPTFEMAKFKWLYEFVKNTVKNKYEENTIKTIEMGLFSQAYYDSLIDETKINFDRSEKGILHFYKDVRYFENAKKSAEIYRENGCNKVILSADGVFDVEPKLSYRRIIGGTYTKTDWTGDVFKFCLNLESYLRSKGVEFIFSHKINSELSDFVGPVIVCAGIGSVRLAKSVGDNLNIYPVKGYSITIENNDPKLLPKVSLLDDEAKIVTSTIGNRLRVAGTAELSGENYDITRSRIEPLLNWVKENFPNIDCSQYNQWACLRPMTPDMLPIVKQSTKKHNIYYNTGHGHLGWTTAPATAVRISDLLEDRSFK